MKNLIYSSRVLLALAASHSFAHAASPKPAKYEVIHRWNQVAIDATGRDHTPVGPGETRVFGEQLGPVRAARAMAITHIAIFESVNAIAGGCQSYLGMPRGNGHDSMPAAVSQAAHDSLSAVFPSQKPIFDAALASDLARIPNGLAKTSGIRLGKSMAAASVAWTADDRSNHTEPRMGVDFIPSNDPGKWRQDPISRVPRAIGARWSQVRPLVMDSADQFRLPPPPALGSPEYTAACQEVKRLGGDGITTPTERTADQTLAGIFWAYDGTPSLCAPPRLYNQIAIAIADQRGTKPVELARLLALVNVAMSDSGIAAWDCKYFYQVWRPVTGIREADASTGPSGLGDGNAATLGDANFTPLGAPASNLNGPNFTPPFPAYPSGHATFGGALFQTLRRFYKTDKIAFNLVSDEYNGLTKNNTGTVRPRIVRKFKNLKQAEEENGQSRIYLGIHWSFDKTGGIAQGNQVADYVFSHAFRPLRK